MSETGANRAVSRECLDRQDLHYNAVIGVAPTRGVVVDSVEMHRVVVSVCDWMSDDCWNQRFHDFEEPRSQPCAHILFIVMRAQWYFEQYEMRVALMELRLVSVLLLFMRQLCITYSVRCRWART